MLSREELADRRARLVRAWEQQVTGGGTPAGLAPPVLASWRRSAAWVSPDVTAAPVDVGDDAVRAWRGSRIATGLRSAEADVRAAADDGGLVAAVTDRDGRIVWAHGSRVMRARAEQVGFVPGGRWDEASVGTNALALALRTGRPSTVYSAEHFSRAVHGWVCYSVPLSDPGTGDVLGVLDLSTTWDRAHPLAMSTAGALARLVTSAMPAAGPADRAALGLDLRVLGGWSVRVGGRPLVLPRRQVEVLVLLALHPSGLSLESLHARLYGDAPVATATLKAEVSRLRTALAGGIGSRPYRLTVPHDGDLQRVLRALDAGDAASACALAAGPLLPGSESPEVGEWRDYVDVGVREAVLAQRDPDVVLRLADREPYDLQLQEHLLDVLRADDPRAPSARARLHRALAPEV